MNVDMDGAKPRGHQGSASLDLGGDLILALDDRMEERNGHAHPVRSCVRKFTRLASVSLIARLLIERPSWRWKDGCQHQTLKHGAYIKRHLCLFVSTCTLPHKHDCPYNAIDD